MTECGGRFFSSLYTKVLNDNEHIGTHVTLMSKNSLVFEHVVMYWNGIQYFPILLKSPLHYYYY